MSINASWLRMFLLMRERLHFAPGSALAFGVQDVMFDHDTAAALLAAQCIYFEPVPQDERMFSNSRNQQQFNKYKYMHVKDLFRMFGFASLETLDAFDNDKPDLLWDLSKPIPEKWQQRYDFLFDIGTMEHTSDIFQALENAANFVKVGGWMSLFLPMVSPIPTCMYHPNPPFYFDILSANGFKDFTAWVNFMPAHDLHSDIPSTWLSYEYNDNPKIWQEGYWTAMMFWARKREHVGEFQPVLQGYYKDWHSGAFGKRESPQQNLREVIRT